MTLSSPHEQEKSASVEGLETTNSTGTHSTAKPDRSSGDAKTMDVDDFPDGGFRAWLVVLGTTCATFASFGYVNAWGVFQAYYSEGLLSHVSPSTIAWIGSLQYALVFAFGLLWGRLFDKGIFHTPLIIASTVQVAATFLVGECKEYWQFFLCQGVTVGLASGCVFGPTLAVLAHWFKKRRSTAYGLAATGSSIGGTVFPIAVQNLLPKVGFQWTMRILGFILLVAVVILNLTVRRRFRPVATKGGLLNLQAFKHIPFTLYTTASFVCFLGLYTVLTYIDLSANEAGIDPSFDVYFLAIANGSSFFGRIISGYLSDKAGPLSLMMPATLVAAATTYAWPYAHSKDSLIVISVIYGFSSGVFIALLAVPLVHMGGVADVGRRTGMLMSILSIGALVGPPISGAIADRTGSYQSVGFYAGSAIVLAVILMWIVKYLVTGHIYRGKF